MIYSGVVCMCIIGCCLLSCYTRCAVLWFCLVFPLSVLSGVVPGYWWAFSGWGHWRDVLWLCLVLSLCMFSVVFFFISCHACLCAG